MGDENIFIFGKTVEEVQELRRGGYDPWKIYEEDEELKAVLDWLLSDYFSFGSDPLFGDLGRSLLDQGDPYLVLADFRDYVRAQESVSETFANKDQWGSMAIRNVARSGKFSSDRTIREYASDIWELDPLPVEQ